METPETIKPIPEALKAAHAQRMAEIERVEKRQAVRGLEKSEPAPPIMGLSAYKVSTNK